MSHKTPSRPTARRPTFRAILGALSLLSLTAFQADALPQPVSPVHHHLAPRADDPESCSFYWGREDCGYVGINEQTCRQRQCCWEPSMAPIPWCFQKKDQEYQCASDMASRRDCGFMGITSDQCNQRNCCWDATANKINAPFCFFRQSTCKGYSVQSAKSTDHGWTLDLGLEGSCQRFGQDLTGLRVDVDFETESRVRVKILDPTKARYEVPEIALDSPESTARRTNVERSYAFNYTENPFTFSVTRISTGEKIFDSNVAGLDSLVFEDEYLEISTALPQDANIYGFGEVVSKSGFRRDTEGTRQAIWARDAATPVDENLYGSHPFHLEMRNGLAHGVFLRNSNGMDVMLSSKKLTYKVIGGIIDFTVFLGPKPNDVIDQYTEVIGRPHMPPAWSLGFHQCRYGYGNIDEVETVVRRYRESNLPLDGVWIDIDYMEKFRDFTYDPLRFPQSRVKALADNLKANNQSMILILDPGIPLVPGYKPYDQGMNEGVFITTKDGKPIEGRVWPGQTYFPDFMNTNETWTWWTRQLKEMHQDIGNNVHPWIDMNEPSNFCNGECQAEGSAANKKRADGDAEPALKYMINNGGRQAPLDEKTIAENAFHKNGMRMLDTHNLYGHMEAKATRQGMLESLPNTRPFILTRSSFAGTGDNWSQWEHLQYSIPGILNFGLFGIPFTGADICGFIGDTNEELCLRWQQLGALYPFARNHNTIGAASQEPYVWPNTVLPAARRSLELRYSLISYYYTLFQQSHQSGKPVWQPLFFQFPDDPIALKVDQQFMIGDALMVSPALTKGQINVNAYFPGNGRWFDYATHECLIESDNGSKPDPKRGHRYRSLSSKAEQDPIPVSIAGGHVVPIQNPKLTVAATRLEPVSLVVAMTQDGLAQGKAFIDDGVSVKSDDWASVEWRLSAGGQFTSTVTTASAAGVQAGFGAKVQHSDTVERIIIMGLNQGEGQNAPSKVQKRKDGDRASILLHKASNRRKSHNSKELPRVKNMAAADAGASGKVLKLASLNVNGAQIPLQQGIVGDEQKGQDPASGVAWEVNQQVGSLSLSGVKMNLFDNWHVSWTLQ
ncbi:hypothetical protein BGW38_001583 [Lunasporangiospora selenospora]|uniref:Maltase n=1 Tax=Lunasporangiospora selenospora TaxID=979761 RepID=A0A9P6FTW8_9FUNG|nr:hypothetical protein BGW38_001583 [Lunasporangiospora selenospora]